MEEALPLAFTAAWASGINPYVLVFALGIIGRVTAFDIPVALERTDVLIVFALAVVVDVFASNIAGIDTVWDRANTVLRPVAGAFVAVLIASPTVELPTAAIFAFGFMVALIAHRATVIARRGVKGQPQPTTNITLSVTNDIALFGVVLLAVFLPLVAAWMAAAFLVFAVLMAVRGSRRARLVMQDRREAQQRRRENCASVAAW